MNREIKFRAWLGSVMVQVVKLDFLKRPDGIYLNTGTGYFLDGPNKGDHTGFDMNKATFLEFTGLKDKNGKEIYEGDIVIAWSQGQKEICEVKWGQGRVGFFLYRSPLIVWNFSGGGFDYTHESVEVIGNIYEKPRTT